MIPAQELSNVEFASRFPSKGQIPTDPADGIKDRMNHESILNDIPPKATSCLVYHDKDLQKHRPDPPIYPIPVDFQPYRKLKSLQAVFKTLPGSSDACIFSHMFISFEDVEIVLGKEFIRCLEEVQRDITGEGKFKKAFERFSGLSPNRDGTSSFTLAGTVQSKPNILSPVAHSTGRSPTEDGFRELIGGLNQKLASLGCAVVQELFPAQTSRLQGLRQNVLDAPLFGSADNHSFSTVQLNISALNKALATSLGYSGASHIDRHDDPMSLSLLICLSRLKADTHPGEFYLGETREWCTLHPFSLLIFRGTGPHGGTQAKPSGDPRDGEKRINAILYPRREFVNRTLNLQWPCYEVTRVSDYSFFHDGGACFGTKGYYQAWCSRELFRHFLRDNKQFGHPLDNNDLQQAFKSATGSEKRYIDPDSDDGKAILETVAKANKLLNRLRPPWQEPRKEGMWGRINGKLPSSTPSQKLPPREPVSKAPQNQESSAASPRSRVKQNPAVQSRGTPASPAIEKPPLEPAKTRMTRSMNNANKSTEDSSGELKGGQIEKEPLAESDLSQTHRKLRSGNNSRNTDLDKYDSISAIERMDDSDIPALSSHKSADQDLATVLLKMKLFNVSELKWELELLRQTAKLCPPKFRVGRMPRISTKPDFGRVASARPLPNTSGTTLAEEMIQLGELFYWITQKNEQLQLYQRHLSQTFHTTLLQVKPMLDLARLKQLFKDRAHSAGSSICSRKLIDAVIEMIERSAEPDSVGNIFRFDAKKILGEHHQQKFCSSVEVVMRPFHGRDIHAHQAQHFREIAFRMFFVWPLQTFLNGPDDWEDLQLSVSNRTVRYERTTNACTSTLRRFLKKLEILQQISQVFGKNHGSFRIPQLKSFLYQTSRTLSDKHIAQLSVVVNRDERFKESLGLLDRLGTELSLLYKDSEPEEGTSPSNAVTEPSLSPVIREFIRFIEVSAGIPHELRSDERSYQAQMMTDPGTFLCFQEHNDTYRHLISSFKLQSALNDQNFLSRWMMWRLYAWGLPELQGTTSIEDWITGPEHVFRRLAAGNTANNFQRKACGSRNFAPTDLESIMKISERGVRIWETWRKRGLPIGFSEAQRAIRGGKIPMYSTASSAPLLLYRDLSRLGIIIPPTESEMAKVIIQQGSAALKGLNILGFGCSEHDVKEAMHLLCYVLNRHLDEKVKLQCHEGQVGLFDLELALCKVCKKQSQDITISPFWPTSNKRKDKGAVKSPGGCKRRKLNGND